MALPVWGIDGRILHRMSTMDHLTIAYIDSDMRYRLPCVVSSSKENQISRCASDWDTGVQMLYSPCAVSLPVFLTPEFVRQ